MVSAVTPLQSSAGPQGLTYVRLAALPHGRRILLRLSGADVRRFLQGILSADVEAARPGHALPAAILTVKGKLVTEAIVLACADGSLHLALPAETADEAIALLDRHIIMDDVALERADDVEFVMVWSGPVAGEGVECLATQYPAPGFLVFGAPAAVISALAGATEAPVGAWDRRRIEAAAPAWGVEITPGTFPPEVGFVAAVSYDKGCFMGQEPLARIHARGQVNRVLVRVHAGTCPEGPVELAAAERPQAGRAATWVADPAGGADGLAIVHRSAATPGTTLTAEEIGAVEVRSGPLGDDPGIKGRK
jgi:folate-binding protein YgfZ